MKLNTRYSGSTQAYAPQSLCNPLYKCTFILIRKFVVHNSIYKNIISDLLYWLQRPCHNKFHLKKIDPMRCNSFKLVHSHNSECRYVSDVREQRFSSPSTFSICFFIHCCMCRLHWFPCTHATISMTSMIFVCCQIHWSVIQSQCIVRMRYPSDISSMIDLCRSNFSLFI